MLRGALPLPGLLDIAFNQSVVHSTGIYSTHLSECQPSWSSGEPTCLALQTRWKTVPFEMSRQRWTPAPDKVPYPDPSVVKEKTAPAPFLLHSASSMLRQCSGMQHSKDEIFEVLTNIRLNSFLIFLNSYQFIIKSNQFLLNSVWILSKFSLNTSKSCLNSLNRAEFCLIMSRLCRNYVALFWVMSKLSWNSIKSFPYSFFKFILSLPTFIYFLWIITEFFWWDILYQ